MGWYMVQSGLTDRVDVSQYRLAMHLGLALIIFAACFWLAMSYWRGIARCKTGLGRAAILGRTGRAGHYAIADGRAGCRY